MLLNQNTIGRTDLTTLLPDRGGLSSESPVRADDARPLNVDVLPHYSARARFWLALFAAFGLARLSVDAGGAHFQFLEGAWTTAGLRHHVARAPVDPVFIDADRSRSAVLQYVAISTTS